MRKVLLFILFVIILISLSWFSKASAQGISQISDKEKQALIDKYRQSVPAKQNLPQSYTTPKLYDSTSLVKRPVTRDSLSTQAEDQIVSKAPVSTPRAYELTPFENLKPFGLDLFASSEDQTPPEDIASSPDYVLGPGDNLVINLWGRVEREFNLTVDREGTVFIPKAGTVTASGMRLSEFKEKLKRQLSGIYTDFELVVSLGKIRSIRVYVTGEIKRPGAYTVSSLTSLYNALYLAGGPNERGSMRRIRLMRNGVSVAELDLYKFLLEGDNRSDIRLESGDAIFVPVTGPRVAVRGKVNREAIYELKENETASQLLELSGRATAEAYLGRVMVERIANNNQWEVLDLNLADTTDHMAANTAMHDGDRVTVFSVFEAKTNMVAINGQVKHPGYFERSDSTTVADLLNRGQLQDYDVYYERANLFRRYSDWRTEVIPVDLRAALAGDTLNNLKLQDRDSLHVYSLQDVTWQRFVYIDGEVAKPGTYPFYDKMTVKDLIFLAGSFKRGASLLQAEIGRVDNLGQVQLIYVSLQNGDDEQVTLQEEDRVYVRQIPQWQLHRTVLLEGEVLFPGEYLLQDHETLYQLLTRAGGFAPNAFPQGLVFERRSIGNSLDRLRIPSLLEKSNPVVRDSTGQLTRSQLFVYDSSAVNRIVIDVNEIVATKGKRGDVILSPGDHIMIPSIPSGISVLGAVSSNGTIQYNERKSVDYYVKRAGNFTRHADKKGTNLIKANGAVFAGNNVLGRRVEMGDIIVVPTKIATERDWSKTLTTIVSATAGLLTTVLVVDKL